MDKNKAWMLVTYYCPTHGDTGRIEPIEITSKDIRKHFLPSVHSEKKREIKE